MTHNEPAPKDFVWPNGAKLALSIVVNVEEGAERGILQGDKANEPVDELVSGLKAPIRVHGNESNYQYGINRGAPRILKLLNAANVPATWTVCAQALEKAPWIADAIRLHRRNLRAQTCWLSLPLSSHGQYSPLTRKRGLSLSHG